MSNLGETFSPCSSNLWVTLLYFWGEIDLHNCCGTICKWKWSVKDFPCSTSSSGKRKVKILIVYFVVSDFLYRRFFRRNFSSHFRATYEQLFCIFWREIDLRNCRGTICHCLPNFPPLPPAQTISLTTISPTSVGARKATFVPPLPLFSSLRLTLLPPLKHLCTLIGACLSLRWGLPRGFSSDIALSLVFQPTYRLFG